jgi:hypothetical protein
MTVPPLSWDSARVQVVPYLDPSINVEPLLKHGALRELIPGLAMLDAIVTFTWVVIRL